MFIRHTQMDDLKEVMRIYENARAFMAQHGNPRQWGPTKWPPEQLICQDILSEKSYVCIEEDSIAAVFFFDYGPHIEPTYEYIEGSWLQTGSYGVVHRIASSGVYRGAGSACIQWAMKKCDALRIDTHFDNYIMQHTLEKLGFARCGIIYVHEDKDPRIAYEWIGTKQESAAT